MDDVFNRVHIHPPGHGMLSYQVEALNFGWVGHVTGGGPQLGMHVVYVLHEEYAWVTHR